MKKVVKVIDDSAMIYALGQDNEVYKSMSNILSSNIDQSYKGDAIKMYTESAKLNSNQRMVLYKTILYNT